MKSAPVALASFLASMQGRDARCWRADLVTVTLLGGTVYRWTTSDLSITYLAQTYLAGGSGSPAAAPLVKRGGFRQSAGLVIDTLDLVLSGDFSINGNKLAALGAFGFFDGARVKIDHMVGAYPGDTSLGAIDSYFEGPVASVDPRGLDVTLRLKSQLELLNLTLPRFSVTPQCGNALHDANCKVSRASYTLNGTVSGSPTVSVFTTSTGAIQAKATGYYNLGVVNFTSGVNAGFRRAVSAFTTGTGEIVLQLPLPAAPSAGDTFSISSGCDRSYAICSARYSNLARYRGFPWVPKPEAGG